MGKWAKIGSFKRIYVVNTLFLSKPLMYRLTYVSITNQF
jgi:hypothetical protein